MKLALKIIAVIFALIVVAVLALIIFFDLNKLKPHIEAAAREQGVELQINGDFSWTFWPSIGVAVEDIRVAALAAPEQPIAQLEQASLMVALMPLLSGNIQVDHVRVEGAAIELAVDEQGTGNWEAFTTDADATDEAVAATPLPDASPAPSQPAAEESREFTLAIDRISLLGSSLNYRDGQSGQHIAVEDVELDIRQFNLQGDPFDMTLALTTTLADEQSPASAPMIIALDASHRVQLSPELDRLQLSDGTVDVTLNKEGKVSLQYQFVVDDLQGDMRYSGDIEVPTFNARNLLAALGTELETSESYALSKVSLEAKIAGDTQQVSIDPLQLTLDKTRVTGSVMVTDIATSALRVVLNGDEINVDDYLAPSTEEVVAVTPAAGAGDEELIPLQTIRELDADIRLDFGKVTVAAMPLEDIQFHLTANNGLVTLQQGNAQVYQGRITSRGTLDGRGNTAVINLTGNVNDVQLAPALKDFELDERVQITGAINADTTASLRGVTMNELLNSLTGEANFSGDEIRFAPLNIEQRFCQVVSLVNQQAEPKREWEAFTPLRELTGKATITQQVITVESFNAGVHQLVLGVQGQLNLQANEYDFVLPLTLLNEESSENGCRVNSNYWINRSLSLLRCRGALDAINPVSDCRPDSKGLTSLTKDFAEFKLRERHGDKIDAAEQKLDAKKDELRQKLDEKLGAESEGQKPRDLLKGLLNRKLEERNRESAAESSAPAEEPAPAP